MGGDDDLVIRISAVTTELVGPINAGTASLHAMTAEAKKGRVASLGHAAALNKVASMADRLGGRLWSFLRGAGNAFLRWAKRGALALATLVVAGAKWGFSLAQQLQQAQIGFTKMLGSSGAARKFLADLTKWSYRTPFRLPDLIKYSQQLLSLGLTAKGTRAGLQALGDAASASGRIEAMPQLVTAVGRVDAMQRITARDISAFASGGVGLKRIIEQRLGIGGDELAKLLRSNGGSADLYRRIGGTDGLIALIEGKYKGGLEKQSNTIKGLFTTFKDVTQKAIASAETPLIKAAQGFLLRNRERFERLGERVGNQVPLLFKYLGQGRNRAAGGTLSKLFGLGDKGTGFFEQLIRSFRATGQIIRGLVTPALQGLGDALGVAFGDSHGGKSKTFAQTLERIAAWVKTSGPAIRTTVATVIGAITDTVKLLADAFNGVATALSTIKSLAKNPAIRALIGASAGGIVAGVPGAVAGGVIGAATAGGRGNSVKGKIVKKALGVAGRVAVPVGIGAGVGSFIFPGGGTAVGAALGGLYGLAFGDTTRPRAFAGTMAALSGVAALTGGQFAVTSGMRDTALGYAGSRHQSGYAVDVTGSHLGALVGNWNASGGYGAIHGAGTGRHAHLERPAGDTTRPRAAGGFGVVPQVVVHIDARGSDLTAAQIEAAARRGTQSAIGEYVRNGYERSV